MIKYYTCGHQADLYFNWSLRRMIYLVLTNESIYNYIRRMIYLVESMVFNIFGVLNSVAGTCQPLSSRANLLLWPPSYKPSTHY